MVFMSDLSTEILEEAFIRPIRFAMLLDDQFPTYPETFANGPNDRYDYDRARRLFALCRNQGWLCDVDNRARIAVQFEDEKHLHQSDLLVLDFHLDPANSADPSEALSIIQKLSSSNHFNLVLLYTSENPSLVIKDVAYALGAGISPCPDDEKFSKILDNLEEDISKVIADSVNAKLLENFLSNGSLMSDTALLRDRMKTAGISAKDHLNLISNACYEHLANRCSKSVTMNRARNACVNGNFSSDASVKWLTYSNVFVAVANKNETVPEEILGTLRSALAAWNPTPLQIMMIHARSALEKAGNISDSSILSDPARQAGWLLPILLTPEESSRDQGLTELYGRLFSRLIKTIGPSVTRVGKMLLSGHEGHPTTIAKSLARSKTLSDKDVYHALNEHLCSEEHPNGAITTGVIFHDIKAQDFWLCTTPACDLVPGRKKGGVLDPWLPITAVKMTVIKKPNAVIDNLQSAELGNHIFIRVGDKPIVLEASDPNSRQMIIENVLLKNEGIIDEGRVSGCRVQKDEAGHPVWHNQDFVVIGRLRTAYADRLLAATGNQRSRIGVDFVNMPPSSAVAERIHFGERLGRSPIDLINVNERSHAQFGVVSLQGLSFSPGIGDYGIRVAPGRSALIEFTNDFIKARASETGTAFPTCTPPAINPPEKTKLSGNV
jgi:hypothetical protein